MIHLWPRSLLALIYDVTHPHHPCGDPDCTNQEDDHR